MTVPAPKFSPLPAAMIALAFATVSSADAEDGKKIHMKTAAAMTAEIGPASAMTAWASAFAPARPADAAMSVAVGYDAALLGVQTSLASFRLASSHYAASMASLGKQAWTNVHDLARTARVMGETQPVSAAALARTSQGAQAVLGGLLSVADIVGTFGQTVEEDHARAETSPALAGMTSSFSSATSALSTLQQAMIERLDWTQVMQAMEDLSHDVIAVIGPTEQRAVPRNAAFIQIKAASDALADIRAMKAPEIDVLAITNMEILRLAGRGL